MFEKSPKRYSTVENQGFKKLSERKNLNFKKNELDMVEELILFAICRGDDGRQG